jgi:hypothetical protein
MLTFGYICDRFSNMQANREAYRHKKSEKSGFYITKTVTLWWSQIESFKSPSLAGVFVTICDFVYFYTSLAYSTDLLI